MRWAKNADRDAIFKTELTTEKKSIKPSDLDPISDMKVTVEVWAGAANLRMNQLLKLGRGAVIELDSKIGESMAVTVNGRPIAKGEIVVVEDVLGVSLNEIQKEAK